jgi:hypothetical protein
LISECSPANIDFLLQNGNNKQYNELKPTVYYIHDPPPLLIKEVVQYSNERGSQAGVEQLPIAK